MTPERIEQEQKAKWISHEESLPEYGQIVWVGWAGMMCRLVFIPIGGL